MAAPRRAACSVMARGVCKVGGRVLASPCLPSFQEDPSDIPFERDGALHVVPAYRRGLRFSSRDGAGGARVSRALKRLARHEQGKG